MVTLLYSASLLYPCYSNQRHLEISLPLDLPFLSLLDSLQPAPDGQRLCRMCRYPLFLLHQLAPPFFTSLLLSLPYLATFLAKRVDLFRFYPLMCSVV